MFLEQPLVQLLFFCKRRATLRLTTRLVMSCCVSHAGLARTLVAIWFSNDKRNKKGFYPFLFKASG
jgi:hypothetical protein